MKSDFINELKALCEKYGLCVVPEENDKYELPLIIAPYKGANKSLYDDLDETKHDKELLKKFSDRGINVIMTEMVFDAKSKKMVETGSIKCII